ncbi:MAG: hypothetical protein PVG30_06355 [Gammaproteobacteria bacterium]|jgi:hypothetical protein
MAIENTGGILGKLQKGLGREAAAELEKTAEMIKRFYAFKKFDSAQPQKNSASKEIPVFKNRGTENIDKNDLRRALKTAGITEAEAAPKAAPKAGFFGGKNVGTTTEKLKVETPKTGFTK